MDKLTGYENFHVYVQTGMQTFNIASTSIMSKINTT